ncbi:hypothetical protein R6Q57_008326 [Mikania cordata]
MQILWKDNHNLALLLSPPPESQRLFSAIHCFNTCKISHALRMNPVIPENLTEEFRLAAKVHKEGDGGKETIIAEVQNIEIVISEAEIREVMGFIDKSTDPVSLEKGVIEGVLSEWVMKGNSDDDIYVEGVDVGAVQPTESVPRSTESTAGPSSYTKDVDYDSFFIEETRARADKGKNVLPNDEHIDVTENEAKDKIKDLETNMGHLSAIVLDMKLKLQDKFKGEFLDESGSSAAVESKPEMSRAKFDALNRSRE